MLLYKINGFLLESMEVGDQIFQIFLLKQIPGDAYN
jgi:hypothetical protein